MLPDTSDAAINIPIFLKMNEGLKELYDIDHLYTSYKKTKRGTDWKESVQKYEINLLENLCDTSRALRDGTYKFGKINEFKLNERGHTRFIKSHHIRDRVVLYCFVEYVLLPRIRPRVIYDNTASLEKRGVSRCRKRLDIHLNDFFKKYGTNDGYIRIYDFSKFYDNIPHDKILEMFRPLLNDEEYNFLENVVKHFEFDLSFLSDEEFAACRDGIFNSLNYINASKSKRTGEKMLKKSVGIGSPVSQTIGIFYPHVLDDYLKIVRSVKWYARYNDDFYIIARTKEELDAYDEGIKQICIRYGLYLNPKKIRTVALRSEFVFLKQIYKMLSTGRIIKRMHKTGIQRCRVRLRKHARLMREGKMTKEHALECFQGWRGTYHKFDSKRAVYKIDKLFCKLFNYERKEKPWQRKKR